MGEIHFRSQPIRLVTRVTEQIKFMDQGITIYCCGIVYSSGYQPVKYNDPHLLKSSNPSCIVVKGRHGITVRSGAGIGTVNGSCLWGAKQFEHNHNGRHNLIHS